MVRRKTQSLMPWHDENTDANIASWWKIHLDNAKPLHEGKCSQHAMPRQDMKYHSMKKMPQHEMQCHCQCSCLKKNTAAWCKCQLPMLWHVMQLPTLWDDTCQMLQHEEKCCDMKKNAMAKKNATAWRAIPQHKE